MSVFSLLTTGFAVPGLAAGSETTVATTEKPAQITATASSAHQPGQSTYLEIKVLGFTPPNKGNVDAVVKMKEGSQGVAREIGRFGLFPNAEFKVSDPSQAERHSLPIPEGKLSAEQSQQIQLEVELVPSSGDGKGARIELGGAEIHKR